MRQTPEKRHAIGEPTFTIIHILRYIPPEKYQRILSPKDSGNMKIWPCGWSLDSRSRTNLLLISWASLSSSTACHIDSWSHKNCTITSIARRPLRPESEHLMHVHGWIFVCVFRKAPKRTKCKIFHIKKIKIVLYLGQLEGFSARHIMPQQHRTVTCLVSTGKETRGLTYLLRANTGRSQKRSRDIFIQMNVAGMGYSRKASKLVSGASKIFKNIDETEICSSCTKITFLKVLPNTHIFFVKILLRQLQVTNKRCSTSEG